MGPVERIFTTMQELLETDALEPKKQLAIVYDHYIVDTGSVGDLVTVNSYSPDSYKEDLSQDLEQLLSDFVDVRPRVKNYDPATDTDSPFEYDFRDFSGLVHLFQDPCSR